VKFAAAARLGVLSGALLVAACAELQLRLPEQEPQFELAGRIAVRYRDEASSANIAWRHGESADEVLITSALGQGVARIVRAGGAVSLFASDGKEHRAADAETLTEQVLGFRLPLDGLADWVRGRAASTPATETRDASGRLAELRQSGWTIQYQEWGEAGRLPVRLRLLYPGLELRLAISEWK